MDRITSEYFVSFKQCSMLIFIYTLTLPQHEKILRPFQKTMLLYEIEVEKIFRSIGKLSLLVLRSIRNTERCFHKNTKSEY